MITDGFGYSRCYAGNDDWKPPSGGRQRGWIRERGRMVAIGNSLATTMNAGIVRAVGWAVGQDGELEEPTSSPRLAPGSYLCALAVDKGDNFPGDVTTMLYTKSCSSMYYPNSMNPASLESGLKAGVLSLFQACLPLGFTPRCAK